MKVVKDYKTHKSEAYLEDTNIHCPSCGVKNVKVENTEGDYYVGPEYYCLSCRYSFTFQAGGVVGEDYSFVD